MNLKTSRGESTTLEIAFHRITTTERGRERAAETFGAKRTLEIMGKSSPSRMPTQNQTSPRDHPSFPSLLCDLDKAYHLSSLWPPNSKMRIVKPSSQCCCKVLLCFDVCVRVEPVRVLDTQMVRTQMLADSLHLAFWAHPSSLKTARLQSLWYVGLCHGLRLAEDPLSLQSLHCSLPVPATKPSHD